MNLLILYRGPLSSCNYGCPYCPFAKHRESLEEHRADSRSLQRFVEWVQMQAGQHQIGIFFTPWGEALIHRRYQHAFIELTRMPHVHKVAIQTNLSSRMDWIRDCDHSKIGLWATYHPGEVSAEDFLKKCEILNTLQVRYSVGVVGMKEHRDAIQSMREQLPSNVYLWINAYKRQAGYYTDDELTQFEQIDPLFPLNNLAHPSMGKACRAGETTFTVDGHGDMRRCHFIKEQIIGNIYQEEWAAALQTRSCTNETCRCHIGYIHMPELKLYEVFGEGILERIPASPVANLRLSD